MLVVDIIINCADCLKPARTVSLIKALAKRQEASGEKTYLVHVNFPNQKLDPSLI